MNRIHTKNTQNFEFNYLFLKLINNISFERLFTFISVHVFWRYGDPTTKNIIWY